MMYPWFYVYYMFIKNEIYKIHSSRILWKTIEKKRNKNMKKQDWNA
jgi:hypothetical protein